MSGMCKRVSGRKRILKASDLIILRHISVSRKDGSTVWYWSVSVHPEGELGLGECKFGQKFGAGSAFDEAIAVLPHLVARVRATAFEYMNNRKGKKKTKKEKVK